MRTVFCKKYQEQLEGLDYPPFPNDNGKQIFETISKKAWIEWTDILTRLINERQLNTLDTTTSVFLNGEREKFFNNEDIEQAEGYVPEDK
jgi:Fe-S cluster biosynthesis and repair protein YggX